MTDPSFVKLNFIEAQKNIIVAFNRTCKWQSSTHHGYRSRKFMTQTWKNQETKQKDPYWRRFIINIVFFCFSIRATQYTSRFWYMRLRNNKKTFEDYTHIGAGSWWNSECADRHCQGSTLLFRDRPFACASGVLKIYTRAISRASRGLPLRDARDTWEEKRQRPDACVG